MAASSRALLLLLLLIATGCTTSHRPRVGKPENAARVSPLGPSYVLVPLPNEDQGLLGRVLPSVPDAGRSLDEVSQPNPCAEHLAPPATTSSLNVFEDAEELSMNASASATLGMFGFRADAGQATHFIYELQTEKQVHQRDTAEYASCCREKPCGYGYIAALVYGSGEYASAEEARGSGRVDVAFASGEGSVGLRVLHRRNVRGYLAAIVRVTERGSEKRELGPLGVADSAVNLSTTSAQYRQMYDKEKMWVCTDGVERTWAFCDVRGKITENEFVRRYRDTTESDELDDLEFRRRSITVPAILTGAAALSLGVGIYLLADGACEGGEYNSFSKSTPRKNPTQCAVSLVLTGEGALLTGLGLFWTLLLDSNYDGGIGDHELTEADGRYYADGYNRALLRKIVRDSERGRRQVGRYRAPRSPSGVQLPPGVFGFTF